MINNFQNLSTINIIYRLTSLIVVYQNHFFLVHSQKISPGNRTNTLSMFTDDRKGTVSILNHHVLDTICEILSMKRNQILSPHQVPQRDALINGSSHCKRIKRSHNNCHFLLPSNFQNSFTHL